MGMRAEGKDYHKDVYVGHRSQCGESKAQERYRYWQMALYMTNLLLGLTWRAEDIHGLGSLYGYLLSSDLGLHPNDLILRDMGRERIACRSYQIQFECQDNGQSFWNIDLS